MDVSGTVMKGANGRALPSASHDFWQEKFAANTARDARKTHELKSLGWRVCIIWKCQTSVPQLIVPILVEQMPRLAS
jgi:DNA mismatch endonuclease (patch repair protein)